MIPTEQQLANSETQSTPVNSSDSPALTRLAKIRHQIDRLQLEAKAIEPDCLVEGLNILSEGSLNGKSLVFSDNNARIVLAFKTRYDDKIPTIELLDIAIDREYQRLCQQHQTELEGLRSYITSLEDLIAEAEAKQSALLSSPYLEELKRQRASALKSTEHQVPNLMVYVK